MARVASRNLFELLGDDDDIEAKIELSNDTTPTKNETVVVQKHVDRSRASPKESRLRHEYPQFGNSDNRSGPRDLNVGRRHQDNDNNYKNNNYQSRSSRGSRPGERDRGRGGRRGGGGRGREFDRHSGSGRYNNEKNENKSWESNNADWGNNYRTNSIDKTDNNDNSNAFSSGWEQDNNGNAADNNSAWNVTESQEPTSDWGGSKDQNGDGDGGGGGDWDAGKVETPSWEIQDEPTFDTSGADNKNNKDLGEDEAATKPVETEEVVKTLEEYLSEKAQKVLDISLPEVRKPNEGVDDSQWRDTVPLEKKEDGDILFSGKEYSFKIKNKTKKSKNFLEIKPTFDKPVGFQRGGRGGGGRGRGHGGGGDRNRDDYDNRDNRRGDGGGERRSYDNNRDNRRGDGGGERSYDNNRDNRRGGGGGERSYDNYNNNRRGGERSYDGYNNRENRRGGNGNRSNYVNIDDQGAFPSLGTV